MIRGVKRERDVDEDEDEEEGMFGVFMSLAVLGNVSFCSTRQDTDNRVCFESCVDFGF